MRCLPAALLTLFAAACGGNVQPSTHSGTPVPDAAADVITPPPDVGPPECIPGESTACTCANGASGAQLCASDGSYLACNCETPEAGVGACIPGQAAACACTNGLSGAQTCLSDGTFGPCACDSDGGDWASQKLAWLKAGIVGTWVGSVQNPWQLSFQATCVFDASGHYSAHSPGDTNIVFYYGSNDDAPEKTYDLVDVKANGEGWGEITIYFGPASTNLDEIRHLVLSPDQNQLSFETWHESVYGPISLDLTRQK